MRRIQRFAVTYGIVIRRHGLSRGGFQPRILVYLFSIHLVRTCIDSPQRAEFSNLSALVWLFAISL